MLALKSQSEYCVHQQIIRLLHQSKVSVPGFVVQKWVYPHTKKGKIARLHWHMLLTNEPFPAKGTSYNKRYPDHFSTLFQGILLVSWPKAQKGGPLLILIRFSVPHDRLFLDALERDLKREKMGLEPTTAVIGEPARSFRYATPNTLS